MGGGNCLFGTEIADDKITPLFRGNISIVEVKSADTNPTEIPSTGTWFPGAVDITKYFDISIAGKCEIGTSDRVKLDVQPAGQIPDFFTKNNEGKIVFAAPQIVGTVKAAKGHNSWVQIELKTVNGDLASDVAKHVCLGIKKNGEDSFFDIIHAGNLTSRYIDVTQESYIELVPLVSKTATTGSTGYISVNPGDEVGFTDITIPATGEFNFGSVYRISVSIHEGQWLTDQKCDLWNTISDLTNTSGNGWSNYGRMGIGSIINQNGDVCKDQLFAVNSFDRLSYSSDGIHWIKSGLVGAKYWDSSVYGNGVWCAIANHTNGVIRSTDKGKNWSTTFPSITAHCLNFANGLFMIVSASGIVYTSPDAEIWTETGKTGRNYSYILIYGCNKWMSGSYDGYICCSKDGGKTWEEVSSELHKMNETSWYGGCYINGYFYVIHHAGLIARSQDGTNWKRVFDFTADNTPDVYRYCNITHYKNKLWAFEWRGRKYAVGLFNPDGKIESLEN